MAEINEIISKEAIKGIEQTDKNITSLDVNMKKFIETLIKANSELKKDGVSFKDISENQKKAKENTKQLSEEQKKLNAIEKQSAANTKQVIEAKVRLAQETKKTKDKIVESIAAEKRETGSIDALRAANKKLTTVRNATSSATETGRNKIELINKKIDENNAKIKQNSDALARQKQEIGGYSAGIQDALGGMGLMPPILTKMSGGMKAVSTAAGTGTKAMKLLRVAVIGTGIGALVVAVMALVTWFKKTVAGGEALVRILAPLKAIFQVLVNRVSKLGEALFKFVNGDFSGAMDEFKEATSGVNEELKKQIALQRILAGLEIQLKKDVGDLAIAHQQLKNKIAASRLAARDHNLTISEQIQAQKDAIKFTNELAESRANDTRRQIALMLANEQAGISSQDEINERKKLIAELLSIEGERDKGLLRLVEYLNTLENKQAKLNKADAEAVNLAEERKKVITTLEKATTDVSLVEMDTRAMATIAFAEKTNETLIRLNKEKTDREIEQEREAAEIKKQIRQQSIGLAIEAGQALFAINGNLLEADAQRLQESKAYELQLAGDNADERAKINAKYDKKEAELSRKKAVNDKIAALFNIAINTAVAISKASPVIPLMALAAALGAVQLAVVASKPIPKFYKGTDSAPAGALIAGDRGRELIEHNGNMLMANKPTILSGIEGAKIYTNKETEAIMQGGAGYDSPDLRGVIESNKEIAKAIASQPIYKFETSKRRIIEHRGNYKKTYLNKKVGI